MIRVAVAEDQEMLRSAIEKLLDLEPDIEVTATFATGDEVVSGVHAVGPHVVLLDVEMPGRGGLEIAEELRDSGSDAIIMMLTTFPRPGYIRRAMEAGARAYLTKDAPVGQIAEAIRRAVAGETLITTEQMRVAMSAGRNPLTDRERDVLRAAQTRDTVTEIAEHLHLSMSTVGNYITAAIAKTHSRNRVEAVRVARENGWL